MTTDPTPPTRLAVILRQQGRRQNWLAALSGYRAVYINQLATGRYPMTAQAAERLAPVLGVQPSDLMEPDIPTATE